jgi:hypothetical protein
LMPITVAMDDLVVVAEKNGNIEQGARNVE